MRDAVTEPDWLGEKDGDFVDESEADGELVVLAEREGERVSDGLAVDDRDG